MLISSKTTVASILLVAVFAMDAAIAQFTTTVNRECVRVSDCGYNQHCNMYDFYNYPAMWPPCPHYGFCECIDGTVRVNNGTCVPYVRLNLGDSCRNQLNEQYDNEVYRCDGRTIVCRLPYVLSNGYCQLPVRTVPSQPASIFFTRPPVTFIQPRTQPTQPPVITVGFREQCEARKICDAARGLCCQQRGPSNRYSQCLCCLKTNVYDEGLGYCRPRVYGDYCTENEECNSGLISNTGFECRLGRCRCVRGYDPVDNLFWNETSKAAYSRRICVVAGAVHWVPTGQACTMNPHQFAQYNSTRVCHRRSFCHQCYRQRSTITAGGTVTGNTVMGTCRELACIADGDCEGSPAGFGMTCNRWHNIVDPPCETGMCGCGNNGVYMDRFSRCAPYRKLQLGDRCIPLSAGFNAANILNEDYDASMECVPQGVGEGGYPGYSWGVIKCKLPLIEDYDGSCQRNDDISGIYYQTLNYGEQCDDTDNRIPIARCDAERGLICRNKRCDCSGGSFGIGVGGFVSSSSGFTFWDGNKCRTPNFGDTCNSTAQCRNIASTTGNSNANVCYQGVCTCGNGYQPVEISSISLNLFTLNHQQSSYRTCLRNFTISPKGSQCHMNPIEYSNRLGTSGAIRFGVGSGGRVSGIAGIAGQLVLPAICQQGTYCMRCPADFGPDDEELGICRSFNPPPPRAGQPCDGGPTVRQVFPPPGWVGWTEPAPIGVAWSAWQPPVVWSSWQPPVVWSAWQPPVVWTAWQPPVVWTSARPAVVWSAWQPPVVWSAWQPPPVWQAWQPPPIWQAWQPPPIWQAWQPPPVWQAWQPPVIWQTIRPPVVWTSVQPPVVWTSVRPPVVWSTIQPPVVWTTFRPPVVWTSWRPPVVWSAWIAPVTIPWIAPVTQTTWIPWIPQPPVPIVYAPPTQQLWNTWSAWCRNSATNVVVASHSILAMAAATAWLIAGRR